MMMIRPMIPLESKGHPQILLPPDDTCHNHRIRSMSFDLPGDHCQHLSMDSNIMRTSKPRELEHIYCVDHAGFE
jgi:hypothetical protein